MNIKQFLDSTYLKTPAEANISEQEDAEIINFYTKQAIIEGFKLIMIRPNHIKNTKKIIIDSGSNLLVGTVIDFPDGNSSIEKKIGEANIAIENGADELDFVVNYNAFINNELVLIRNEILLGTKFCLSKNKTIKWIIEVAALTNTEIIEISKLIKAIVTTNFEEQNWQKVFVKSSTGFYKTKDNLPNGATKSSIKLMLDNASPLPIKAAGGIANYYDAVEMITMGVQRIGTSNAKNITDNKLTTGY